MKLLNRLYLRLRQGIDSLDSVKVHFPVIPPEVEDLYSWRDGLKYTSDDVIGNLCFLNLMIFLRIEKAVHIHKVMAGYEEIGWNHLHFPLFESGAGEFILIDCNESSSSYKMLLFHSVGDVNFDLIISIYDSLSTLFKSINECFKDKIYYYENEILKSNYDLEVEVFKKNNPRSAYWKLF